MGVRSFITGDKPVHSEYPCLRRALSGKVVLFNSKHSGTVLIGDKHDQVGDYKDSWVKSDDSTIWSPVKSVTLEDTHD